MQAYPYDLPRPLGDGLVLRWATAADTEALVEFNNIQHSDTDEPDEGIGIWIRDMMEGQNPATGPGDFTVVVDENDGGKIISSLCLISQTWAYEELPFGLGRVEAVATLPEYRRKGLIRAQMDLVHRLSAERGEMAQGITGIPWYYRQFGYEMTLELTAGGSLGWHNVIELAKNETEIYRLRPATLDDLATLEMLYALYCKDSLISTRRNKREWEYNLTRTQEKGVNFLKYYIVEDLEGRPVAYLNVVPTIFVNMLVREMAVMPGYSWLPVCEFLTRALRQMAEEFNRQPDRKTPLRSAFFNLAGNHPIFRVLDRRLEKRNNPYTWYMRVPDLPGFIRYIAPVLERRLQGSVIENYSGTARLNFFHSQLTLVFEKGKLVEVGTYQPKRSTDGDGFFPDLTFLNLVFGHHTVEELGAIRPDCFVQNHRTALLLSTIFPKKFSAVAALT